MKKLDSKWRNELLTFSINKINAENSLHSCIQNGTQTGSCGCTYTHSNCYCLYLDCDKWTMVACGNHSTRAIENECKAIIEMNTVQHIKFVVYNPRNEVQVALS